MKEQWTKDLQQKMNGFEVPTIPEGLWEDIDAALENDDKHLVIGDCGKAKGQTINTQHLTPITRYWRKASAAILLLLAIPTSLYLLRNKENEIAVAELEKNAPLHEISSSKAKTPKDTEASPTLSTPSAKHIAKATIQKTTIAEAPIDNSSNSAIEEQRHKAEEVKHDSPITKQTEEKASTPSAAPEGTHEEPINNYGEDDFTINKKQPENRLYLAMNASGISFSRDMTTTDYTMGYNDPYNVVNDPYNVANNPIKNMDAIPYHEETHHRPISFGLQVGIPVAKDWSVVTGLTYTYLHSEIKDNTGLIFTHTDQKLHFIDIPMQMNYQLYNNRHCNIYLGVGGRADFGVSGKTNHESKLSHLPVNYSLKAAAGVQVNLFKSLNIYAEPTLQYNIPGSTRYKTYYTEHKTMFDLQLGVRVIP